MPCIGANHVPVRLTYPAGGTATTCECVVARYRALYGADSTRAWVIEPIEPEDQQ